MMMMMMTMARNVLYELGTCRPLLYYKLVEVWVCGPTLQKETDCSSVMCQQLLSSKRPKQQKPVEMIVINDYPQICSLQYILLAVKPAEKQEDCTKSDLNIYYLDPV